MTGQKRVMFSSRITLLSEGRMVTCRQTASPQHARQPAPATLCAPQLPPFKATASVSPPQPWGTPGQGPTSASQPQHTSLLLTGLL